MPFDEAPLHVRAWVERELGAEVVEVVDCVGGMSPGPAARVRAAGGRRGFVKACGRELNPDTPGLLRREAEVLSAFPTHSSLPVLHEVLDDGDWVALLIEDVHGALPGLPWVRGDLDRVAQTLAAVREPLDQVLEACAAPALRRARDHAPMFTTHWRGLSDQLDLVPPWWRGRHEVLAVHAARAHELIDGEHLLHWDLRADNVILGPDRTVLVDWGQARIGAGWMDQAMLALDCSMSGSEVSTQEYASSDPVLRERDPADLLSVAAAAAMSFRVRALQPAKPGLPTFGATLGRWAESLVPFLDAALAGSHL